MEITYSKHRDYYLPDLTLPPQPTGDIGRFGRTRKKYLKEHQPDTFSLMLIENTLTQHLIDIDREAKEQLELITSHIAKSEGVTEDQGDELLPSACGGDRNSRYDHDIKTIGTVTVHRPVFVFIGRYGEYVP